MKELFLSFKDEYFEPLLYGIKKYEYRKRFCNEEVKAYLYLSGKRREVVGILELGVPIKLDKTRENYINYPETLKRVDKYIESRDINAVPVKSLSLFKVPITLEELRNKIPNFMPPQMYYDLANHPKLKEILYQQEINKPLYINDHTCVYYDNLAVSIKELKETEEFKKINML